MITAMVITGMWFADPDEIWWKYILAAMVAITYSGIAMIHNDIIDLEIDKINAPHRPIPSGKVSIRQATIYSVVLFIAGTMSGIWLAIEGIIIMFLTLVVSLIYNARLKKTGFLGNLSVGYTATSAFLYGEAVGAGWTHFWPPSLWNQSIYLFLISAILNTSREVAKGIMDVEGDEEHDVRTIAVVYGKQNAARLVIVLLTLALISAIAPIVTQVFSFWFIIAVTAFLSLMLRTGIPLIRSPNYDTARKYKNQLLPNMFIALVLSVIDVILT